jgi:hypothetical protein
VIEKRVLMGTSGPKRDEVTGRWRKLREELHSMYFSPAVRIISSRRMG